MEGLYSLADGNFYALPTHDPIIILHDQSVGLSYSKYEHFVTETWKLFNVLVRSEALGTNPARVPEYTNALIVPILG